MKIYINNILYYMLFCISDEINITGVVKECFYKFL